ncbi:hypothetical protein [Acidiphilium sp. 34-64-41]|uniref:hypothetical protein n=1 Tax=Acidiphilium sp. 34-64-41 TaxID=1970297 RepID=UPI00257D7DE8|nr:hypothetical protein [Acidiphilium sp. 34-64-41]
MYRVDGVCSLFVLVGGVGEEGKEGVGGEGEVREDFFFGKKEAKNFFNRGWSWGYGIDPLTGGGRNAGGSFAVRAGQSGKFKELNVRRCRW